MDKASVVGVILGIVVCIGTGFLIVSHGGSWGMFWSLKGVVMVFGGTISVVFMAMPMDKLKQVPSYIRRFMSNKQMGLPETVETMAMLSDMRDALQARGFAEGSNARPADFVIEKAFVG